MKKGLLLILAVCIQACIFAQVSIHASWQGNMFHGDVGQQASSNVFGNAKAGFSGGVEYRLGKVLGLGLEGTYGKIQGTDNTQFSHKNFQSPVNGGALLFSAYFDRILKKAPMATPFIKLGFGYVMFDPYSDLQDKNGMTYHYWKDGSIRNLSDAPSNETFSTVLKRDYTYETQLKDSSNYARNSFYIPIQLGCLFKLSYNIDLKTQVFYNMSFSDYMDNTSSGGNDAWYGGSVGISYTFRKLPKDPLEDAYKSISMGDEDGDGVIDFLDNCLGTPKGVQVNGNGCPDDSDDDGFFDYRDKEKNSAKKAVVDVEGVTINEDEWAKKQMAWDSLWAERSEEFNNAPSIETLKKIEQKGQELKQKTGKTSPAIPSELQAADLNKDGYISVEEINTTIDKFFDGQNDFNVEKINQLIDFFFEQ